MATGKAKFANQAALAVLLGGAMVMQTSFAAAESHAQVGTSVRKARLVGSPSGDDGSCKVVFDALDKALDVPSHEYLTRGVNKKDGGKTSQSELITVNGSRYVLVDGKWRNAQKVEDVRAQEAENKKNAKVISCKQIGDDTVNGEPATVYAMHNETEDSKSDGKIWLSKVRNLPLKEEISLDTGDSEPEHWSIRFEYTNVKAPQV